MYQDRKNRSLYKVLGALLVCVLLVFAYASFQKHADRDLDEESSSAIREAIRRAALQCYVVEGAYPVDLEYLKENYGLKINEKNYYVVYRAFAQNQLPDIRIVKK